MDFVLRKWSENDLDSLVEHANNINIARWLTNQFPHPYTYEDGRKYLSLFSADDPVKVFAIEVDGKAVGSIGIFPQTDIHEKNAEMGYFLSEKYWGKGIMSRAIRQTVAYGFNAFGNTRIFARPFSSNLASQRVLEKAGFKLEACLEKAIYKNGVYLDELIYAVRKPE